MQTASGDQTSQQETLGASPPTVLHPGTQTSGPASPFPSRARCSPPPKLLARPDRPFKTQDTIPLSFQPKCPRPFPLEKCTNEPRGEDRPLVCRNPHGVHTKARLRIREGGGSWHCLLNVRERAEGQGLWLGCRGAGGQIQPSIGPGGGHGAGHRAVPGAGLGSTQGPTPSTTPYTEGPPGQGRKRKAASALGRGPGGFGEFCKSCERPLSLWRRDQALC